MATFNPGGVTQESGQRAGSRGETGVISQTGNSGLATDLTKLFTTTVNFVDEQNQLDIKEKARIDYEKAQGDIKQAGESLTTELEENEQRFAGRPEFLDLKLQEAKRITNAYQKGALNEANYYARMDVAARELRARYPGYKDEVDRSFSSLVGTRPSNAVMKNIFSRLDTISSNLNNQDTRYQKLLDRASGLGMTDITASNAAGIKLPNNVLLDLITQEERSNIVRKQRSEELTDITKRVGLNNTLNSEERRMATDKAITAFNGEAFNDIEIVHRTLGFNNPETIERMKKVTEALKRGEPVDPKEQEMLLFNMTKGKEEAKLRVRQSLNRYSNDLIDETEKAKLLKQRDDQIDLIFSPYEKGDFSFASRNSKDLGRMKAADEITLRQAAPILRKFSALKSVVGETTANYLVEKNNNLSGVSREAGSLFQFDVALARTPQEVKPIQQALNNIADEKDRAQILDNITEGFKKKDLPTNVRINHLFSVFNSDKSLLEFTSSGSANRDALVSRLTSLETIEAVKELSKINPEITTLYQDWYTRNMSIYLKGKLDNVNEINSSTSVAPIEFDPIKMEFRARKVSETDKTDRYRSTLNDLNKTLTMLRPSLKYTAGNIPERDYIQDMIRVSGFVIPKPKEELVQP
jgi:hypothetical protein